MPRISSKISFCFATHHNRLQDLDWVKWYLLHVFYAINMQISIWLELC